MKRLSLLLLLFPLAVLGTTERRQEDASEFNVSNLKSMNSTGQELSKSMGKGKGKGKGMMLSSSKVTKGKGNSKDPKAAKASKASKVSKKGMKRTKTQVPTISPPPTTSPTTSLTTQAPTTQAPTLLAQPSFSPEERTTRPPTNRPTRPPTSSTIVVTRPPTNGPTRRPVSAGDRDTSAPTAPPPTITEFIESQSDLSILFDALQRVSGFDVEFRNQTLPSPSGSRSLIFQQDNPFRTNDLLNILNAPGDYTFFAPTDDAFRLLPDELQQILFFDDLFLPHLEDLLLYHGLEGERSISEFNPANIATFNIERVSVRRRPNGDLLLNTIPVGVSDNDASNGVTHKLSGVLRPAWLRNSVLDFTRTTGDLSILYELLLLSGLDQVLNILGSGVTLLAPTNDAFNDLDGDTDLPFLRDPANRVELERILIYHIVDGVFTSPRLTNGSNIPTESGSTIAVSVVDQIIMFNQATATSESILASNGVLYEIRAVLNPDSGAGF